MRTHEVNRFTLDEMSYTFRYAILKKNPELLNKVLSLHVAYQEHEAAYRTARITFLENKLDALIETARQKRAKVSQVEDERLVAIRKHADAESLLRNRSSQADEIRWGIENSAGLFTKAERAEHQNQIAKAQKLVEKAALAESQAVTELRYVTNDYEQAQAAYKAAEGMARECEAQLEMLKGKKGGYSQSGLAMD